MTRSVAKGASLGSSRRSCLAKSQSIPVLTKGQIDAFNVPRGDAVVYNGQRLRESFAEAAEQGEEMSATCYRPVDIGVLGLGG